MFHCFPAEWKGRDKSSLTPTVATIKSFSHEEGGGGASTKGHLSFRLSKAGGFHHCKEGHNHFYTDWKKIRFYGILFVKVYIEFLRVYA